ncbi:MAG TPA: CoA transferase [Amycolatopsis sp.]|nr:CoA transferase [Amycolatopsis sp.]
MTALGGLRVVDLSGSLAGALTAMILGDNGADVVDVERPGGNPLRAWPAYQMWHRGHRSVVADLSAATGVRRVRDLAAGADVVVQDWRPGVARRLGVDHARLAADNPGLVTCAITGFGTQGPFARLQGYDAVVAAKSGFFTIGDRPKFSPVPVASFAAANGALQGIFAALYQRETSGRGQLVETSLVQGLTAYDLYDWLEPQVPPDRLVRTHAPTGRSTIYPVISGISAFTKDGRCVQFGNFLPHQLAAFLRATGLEKWYAEHGDGPVEQVTAVARRRISERTWQEWEVAFAAEGDVAAEPYRTAEESSRHPQLVHNGEVVELEDPVYGPTRQLGPMVTLAGTPARIAAGAPEPGEHDATAAFPPRGEVPRAAVAGAPLAGVTVLELASFYAAPFGLALMADLGARVIKVEAVTGDPHRSQSGVRELAGVKGLQGKESVAVDANVPEGLEIIRRLVRRCDMVMRNFRQGATERMGITYESLAGANKDLIYLYAAAYGSSGPAVARPAYAPTIGVGVGHQAMQLGWTRAFDGVPPVAGPDDAVVRGEQASTGQAHPLVNADAGAALAVGTGMLLALLARRRTGIAQAAQTTMLCSNAYAVSADFFSFSGVRPGRTLDDEANGLSALYRLYPASEGWVFLAVCTETEWDRFARCLRDATSGRLDLAADSRFSSAEPRRAHDDELCQALAAELASRPAGEWEALFTARDVACVEVSREHFSRFTVEHEAMHANGFVGEVEHPMFGRHRRHGAIVELSDSPAELGAASVIGQHTRAVLTEIGYSEAELADLRARGVIAMPEA